MNKNLIIAVVAVVAIVVVAVVVGLLGGNGEVKSMDIDAAAQTLSTTNPYAEMAMMDITTEELSAVMGINADNVEKVYGKIPMMNVHASMYLLIQAKAGAVDTVKSELEQYATNYEQQWERYLPEQYDLVKNRKVGVVGNTVYMIIAENAEALEKSIVE